MTDKMIMYKVKVNEFEFIVNKETVDTTDLVKRSLTEYHVIKDHRSVNAKLIGTDLHAKKATVEVDGEIFEVEIKEPLDLMLEKMGFGSVSNRQMKEIKAPMPGLVLEIAVSEGQDVKEGEKILILVAMKMENSIMIHTTAKIKRIAVSAGQAVEKGQLLVELE